MIYFDIETIAHPVAGDFIPPVPPPEMPDLGAVVAPKNYTDPVKIAAYVEKKRNELNDEFLAAMEALPAKRAEAIAECSLDPTLNRVVALSWAVDDADPVTVVCPDEDVETAAIDQFWAAVSGYSEYLTGGVVLAGYNCMGFDLPTLIIRSMLLDVRPSFRTLPRYRHPQIVDLMQVLSFDGQIKFRGLSWWCKRLGIDVADDTDGSQMAALVTANQWDTVAQHVTADVLKTRLLARRAGVSW